jgi:Domain of unknown function (DUF1835)
LLHITNGDCAAGVLSRAVQGTILPWRDVLHEGPVRAGLSLEELSRERAAFIAQAGWGEPGQVLQQFRDRDAKFRRAGQHDEIVLWFEHDLYDQLQLIQVLDGLAELRGPKISLVCEAEYLGTMAAERAAELFVLRNPVTRRHMHEAQAAWAAFRSSNPADIENLRPAALSFLRAALRRHLEELPWSSDGLSLLERRVIEALRGGARAFKEIFLAVEEDPRFLGDGVLAWHLERLARDGLIERRDDGWRLVARQRARREPRWLGGYQVKDEAIRWDPASGRLVT